MIQRKIRKVRGLKNSREGVGDGMWGVLFLKGSKKASLVSLPLSRDLREVKEPVM